MSKNVVVVGAQWGDEGKGKIVDWLTESVQGVVRFNGGHTRDQRPENGSSFDPLRCYASSRQVLHR